MNRQTPKNPRRRSLAKRRLRGGERLEERRLLAVVINEIHYDPDVATEQVEFLELHNTGAETVDLAGWRIDDAVDYTFPAGAEIPAGGFVVVTQNANEFNGKFGFAPLGEWEQGDRLSNEGEKIELLDAAGVLVDEVTYRPGFPWPTVGEVGNSLELINPALDNDLAGSWRSSGLSSSAHAGESLVQTGSVWRYRKGVGSNPPANSNTPATDWRSSDFNELNDAVAWQDGAATLGYGDGDDATVLSDMRFNYSSIYARRTFTLDANLPDALELRVYVDDGAIVYLNGAEVGRFNVSAGAKNHDSTSGSNHEAEWETLQIANASSLLTAGENTVAVHALNGTLDSSDFSFNLELSVPDATVGLPTPGAVNSVRSTNAAPQLRQLSLSNPQPGSGEEVVVTIKATDPDGVQQLYLEYQTVDPGAYIRLTDPGYDTGWTSLAMNDDGVLGDAVAGDDVYSVTLPASLQVHRRLVRYRITAEDALGASVTAPYADDPQPNFAYFVYDGVPDYTASLRPGFEPSVVYSGDALDDIATYHLIANATDVTNSQYNGQYNEVLFRGTLVYDGVVYDHVEFRNRGVASTYQVGKNKWKIEFLNGHHLQARDNYGAPFGETWDEINVLPGTNPWWRNDISTEGTVLSEAAAFKLYDLAGAPSPYTTYFNFRVIDGASETGGDQYSGDFWGLYVGIEQPDGSFLDERGLEDGNVYNMHSSVFGATNQRHQGSESVTDRSDLAAFMSGIDGGFETLQWWEENLNWDVYFAWNIVNHLVNNSDIRPNENVNYYRDQVSGQWYVIPWDLDLTFEDAPHLGNPVTNRENIRSLLSQHPEAALAYENRLREVTDLLLNNGDAALVIEELANVLAPGGDQTIVDANQAMWDFHPRKVKKGIWYENFNPQLLQSETFAGLVDYMQDFVSPGGYGYNLVQSRGSESGVPNKPSISYVGAAQFPVDQLVFEASAFSDPQGAGSFAAMEWRAAEVRSSQTAGYTSGTPFLYELNSVWESGTQTTFTSQQMAPADAFEPGATYRTRVRMQDADGHWSHWSDPIEFVAGAAALNPTVAVTEVHYHPSAGVVADESDLEFIELLNTGVSATDLSGVQIVDFASEPYVIDSGVMLAPGERLIVARTPEVFTAVYGEGLNVASTGFGDRNLGNGGDTVTLLTAQGVAILSFTYDDSAPWPTAADGDGASLEIVDPLGDPNDPANWRASAVAGGSPGAAGLAVPALAGDYDNDGDVDRGDYDTWRSQYGLTLLTPGAGSDGNADGVVNAADYAMWRDYEAAALAAASVTGDIDNEPVALASPLDAKDWRPASSDYIAALAPLSEPAAAFSVASDQTAIQPATESSLSNQRAQQLTQQVSSERRTRPQQSPSTLRGGAVIDSEELGRDQYFSEIGLMDSSRPAVGPSRPLRTPWRGV
ncbi:CotH protein [Posidoniimonas polymericola]|uniref:CotH protein n=1 Tax=Posidoniimonas polymericola TaxID=2528002 RepID=A0A5C5YI83_9BACT|nr:lamin tail domain-containing protein [Posidoniimonas polymericola]TWT74577.1 CotH protein [Posidoniimonas polymericola]